MVREHAPLLVIVLVALGLRLIVWRWRELYPLGGDEQEYLNQALTLLRERRYVELQLMRPPLYTAFLAASIYVLDSLVQRLRLVQEIISALTVVPVYALTLQISGSRRVGLLAALLAALHYTLAATATELLTETVFLFGLTLAFWLLLRAGGLNVQRPTLNVQPHVWATLAGLAVGLLALTRTVALPLLPLSAVWLYAGQQATGNRQKEDGKSLGASGVLPVLLFVSSFSLVVAPWTLRNYLTYGPPPIVVDTTGAENLWLDNNPSGATPSDPLGREAAKRQLYALGDDRAGRQRLATARGTAEIAANPGWFIAKAWGEARKFFALQYFDELREKRAIWVAPLDVWMRLLLGDGLWILILIAGAAGLWISDFGFRIDVQRRNSPISRLHNPKWLLIPWALYVFLTSLVFHVELRYRLPLYPVLLPYAAMALYALRFARSDVREQLGKLTIRPASFVRLFGALLTCLALVGMTLLHRPYISESAMLAGKHLALARAERSLAAGEAAPARSAAGEALARDPESALARVALARAALLRGDHPGALAALDDAIAALPAHPHAHLLRGALLRSEGRLDEARAALAYENSSLEDLQRWAWDVFAPLGPPPRELSVGGGLDLGYVRDFARPLAQDAPGLRWAGARSEVQLQAGADVGQLELELASGRPAGAPPPDVVVLADGREIGRVQPEAGWSTYRLPLSPPPGAVVITLRSDLFRPRDYDRASPDGRALGVQVRRAALIPAE